MNQTNEKMEIQNDSRQTQTALANLQNEARVCQQGTRTRTWAEHGTCPHAPRDTRYEWTYIFGAGCPLRATTAAMDMPRADTSAMSADLVEISKTAGPGAHAVLVMDGAG